MSHFRKTTLWNVTSSVLLFLITLSLMGCEEEEIIEAKITPQTETSVIFSSNETVTTKTFSFSSTKPWQLEAFNETWLDVTPKEGKEGNALLTIQLKELETTENRSVEIKIVSENATAQFSVTQEKNKEPVIELTGVEIINPPTALKIGDKVKLEFAIQPENATINEVMWESSDAGIISVGEEGNIEALAEGSATITVNVNDKTADCLINSSYPDNILTFKKLSKDDYYPVAFEDNEYIVSDNFKIEAGATLLMEDNITVKIMNNVEITVEGMIDFTPETGATVMGYDADSHPKSIYLTGEGSGGNFENITFIDVPIRLFASNNPVIINNCEFKDIGSNRAALDLGNSFSLTVTNSKFIQNVYPAITGAANYAVPLVFKNNHLDNNSLTARNRPQINVTVGGDGLVEIADNTIIGPKEITTNGGIAVSNLMGHKGTNKVKISGNDVRYCRYGITTNGVMNVEISKNELVDNKYEVNPMNGGSGISIYNTNGGQKVVISENIIKEHFWGITIIGNVAGNIGPEVNVGNLNEGDDYNIGKNIFDDNGNNDALYDLFNNSPIDVSAVNNNWGVAEQTEEEIEKVISHKNDDLSLGRVTFMPPYKP